MRTKAILVSLASNLQKLCPVARTSWKSEFKSSDIRYLTKEVSEQQSTSRIITCFYKLSCGCEDALTEQGQVDTVSMTRATADKVCLCDHCVLKTYRLAARGMVRVEFLDFQDH